ncbi:MAG: hypothetical protein RLP11_15850, partial [Marinoscillum sp.]
MFKNNWFIACAFLIPVILTTGCSDKDVPDAENEEEIITKVQLIFSPAEGAPVVVTALDPDGDGPEDIAPSGPVVLAKGTEYELFIKLENTISNEDITEEVEAEGDEIHSYQEVKIKANTPVDFQSDGEYIGELTDLHIRVLPDQLKIIRPD